jgi:hypothetical protein
MQVAINLLPNPLVPSSLFVKVARVESNLTSSRIATTLDLDRRLAISVSKGDDKKKT